MRWPARCSAGRTVPRGSWRDGRELFAILVVGNNSNRLANASTRRDGGQRDSGRMLASAAESRGLINSAPLRAARAPSPRCHQRPFGDGNGTEGRLLCLLYRTKLKATARSTFRNLAATSKQEKPFVPLPAWSFSREQMSTATSGSGRNSAAGRVAKQSLDLEIVPHASPFRGSKNLMIQGEG